jgi:hypothetical protein
MQNQTKKAPAHKSVVPPSDRVEETELLLLARQLSLNNIIVLRDRVIRAGESWPPRRVWFDGYRAGLTR